MIYGPLDVEDATKYQGKQVKLADSIKGLKTKKYDVQELHNPSRNCNEDYPYNGYRYMEPFEEKTHLDHILDHLEYLRQVYRDCVCTIIRDNGNEEDKKQMTEVLNELEYLLSTHNKVDFVTKLFPEYCNITEVDTGKEITEGIEELKLGDHSYRVTILVR